jgi:hypothetical protein
MPPSSHSRIYRLFLDLYYYMKGEVEVPEMSADLLIVLLIFLIIIALGLKLIGTI